MKIQITIIALLLLNITAAQNYKFGKVSKAELSETSNPDNPEAHATVLFKKHRITFEFNQEGFEQVNSYYERIKIYDKEGFEYANKRIKLYDQSNAKSEELNNLKANTYTLVNGKIEKTKLKKEGVFEDKNNKYWMTKSITMPNVSPGCIIEIEYNIKSPFMQIDDIVLQYNIPIKKLDVDVLIPEYFNYNKIVNQRAKFQPEIVETTKLRKEGKLNTKRTEGGFSAKISSITQSQFDFQENIFSIDMDNIPALIEEPFVDNLDNYRGKIALEYAFFKGPSGEFKNYASTWEQVTKNIYQNEDFGGQLNKSKYFEKDIDALIASASSDSEKVLLIFNYVKNKVKWNSYIGYTANTGVKKAYKEGVGNVGDINLMLTAMLKYAKIKANPVLVSTRANGVPLFPTRTGFNYVICQAEIDEKTVLLDATQPFTYVNILPKNVINYLGRLIMEDGTSSLISLLPKTMSKEVVSATLNLKEDLSAEGKVRKVLTNYQALIYREAYSDTNEDDLIINIEKESPGLTATNLTLKDAEDEAKPVSQTYAYTFDAAAEKIGDNIYMSPLLFLSEAENPFTQDSRDFPVDLIYPITDSKKVLITIPDGYTVESLPENVQLNYNGESASFSYLIKHTGNSIQLIVNLNLIKTIVLPTDYQNFKDFFKLMVEKQNEKIVLKKL